MKLGPALAAAERGRAAGGGLFIKAENTLVKLK